MATTYGSFPGVEVTTAGGGITAVAIGSEENLVIFGEAAYAADDTVDGSGTANSPQQINARQEADTYFGADSELADAMKEALANGANIDFMWGVAPSRIDVSGETASLASGDSGTLANHPIVEDTSLISTDGGGLTFEFRYDSPPTAPTEDDTLHINPLTGEYAMTTGTVTNVQSTISYKYLDWSSAFTAADGIVDEDETGVYVALEEAESVSTTLNSEVNTLRGEYQLINAVSGAQPNDNSSESPPDARFLLDGSGNSFSDTSVDADYYFKLAPVRQEDTDATVLGGVAGLFAGNPIEDPIYNDPLSGYSALEQSLSKSEADELRDQNVIPIRSAGSVRVKDNLSTSTETDWERDFWRRRITDRVVLIAKTVGDTIIGDINDEQTRNAAQRQIEAEIRSLVDDRLLRANTTDETNWFVDVYESSTNTDQVNIDIGFTPYGVVKQVEASVTINT